VGDVAFGRVAERADVAPGRVTDVGDVAPGRVTVRMDVGPGHVTDVAEFAPGHVTVLSDAELTARLSVLVRQDSRLTAELLEHLGEMDARRLYASTVYPSAFQYCVGHLGMSEDVAYKRIAAARIARRFPLVLELVRDGRLHLSGLLLVAPHLTPAGHREWLLAACGQSKREVEKLVAERFPRPDVRDGVRKLPERPGAAPRTAGELAGGGKGAPDGCDTALAETNRRVCGAAATATGVAAADTRTSAADAASAHGSGPIAASTAETAGARATVTADATLAPRAADSTFASRVAPTKPGDRGVIEPLAPKRFRVMFTASADFCEKLERARELASHAVSPSDLATLFERALDTLILSEHKRRFALTTCRRPSAPRAAASQQDPGRVRPATRDAQAQLSSPTPAQRPEQPQRQPVTAPGTRCPEQPQPGPAATANTRSERERRTRSRYIPAAVRRAVWARDQGQCTFVDETGQRCGERRFVEFEHIEPYAVGGPATVGNVTLRCTAHNQHAARQLFGNAHIEAMLSHRRGREGEGRG
ncbi:MAG: hypothetical protein JW940_00445, partial [Polyangiaceae bacterium]|nr:hypothetical protein [Polyangiaceae bacterium]